MVLWLRQEQIHARFQKPHNLNPKFIPLKPLFLVMTKWSGIYQSHTDPLLWTKSPGRLVFMTLATRCWYLLLYSNITLKIHRTEPTSSVLWRLQMQSCLILTLLWWANSSWGSEWGCRLDVCICCWKTMISLRCTSWEVLLQSSPIRSLVFLRDSSF